MPGAQDDYELVEDRSMGEKIIIIAILCTMCNNRNLHEDYHKSGKKGRVINCRKNINKG